MSDGKHHRLRAELTKLALRPNVACVAVAPGSHSEVPTDGRVNNDKVPVLGIVGAVIKLEVSWKDAFNP
jgi:hypothetical protein